MLREFVPAAGLLCVGLAGLLIATFSAASSNGQYVVIAPPWASLGQTIGLVGAADGGVVEAGRLPNIVIAASSRSDFPTQARNAGAWFVFASSRLTGCLGARAKGTAR